MSNPHHEKTNHEWTLEWIKEFLIFESELKKLRAMVKDCVLDDKQSIKRELKRMKYLDVKLRYNIRLHELKLVSFIHDNPSLSMEHKAEYKDHKELEHSRSAEMIDPSMLSDFIQTLACYLVN